MKNHDFSCSANLGDTCTCTAPEELCPGCQPCPICGNDNDFSQRSSSDIKEIERLTLLLAEAPKFFAPEHDFDGEKLDWSVRAGLVPKSELNTERSE